MRRALLPFALLLAACQNAPITVPDVDRPPVAAQAEPADWRALLPGQLDAVRASVARYRDIEAAKRDGWKPFAGGADEPLMGQHWYSEDPALDYVSGAPIDLTRPNNLMYTEMDGRMVLTGAAFVVRLGPNDAVPAGFAGPQDRWHVHDFVDAINAATEERPFLRFLANGWLKDTYFRKSDDRARLAMVHVWTENDNPDGVFADYDRTLPYRKLGLGEAYWRGRTVEAAKGLVLATSNGCDNTMGGALWIADASGRQTRELERACADEAARLRAVLDSRPSPDGLDRAARAAWTGYDREWTRVLTPEQRDRVAAMSEHGPGTGHGDHGDGHGGHSHGMDD